jgi:hypothetical protein
MARYLPFNLYLAGEGETEFNPATMAVYELPVLEMTMTEDEGQVPVLDMVTRRPGYPGVTIGLLATGRPVWAWLSYNPPFNSKKFAGHGPMPIMFGVLYAIPSDMTGQKIKVRYQARSVNFIQNKQALGETLKVLGPWDPVWIKDQAKRDNPDTILESYSGVYHFSRLPENGDFVTSYADYCVGPDGTVVFGGSGAGGQPNTAFYDNFEYRYVESPLTNIRIRGKVKWRQRTWGFCDIPKYSISTYTGQSYMEQFPKSGEIVGSGWSMETSYVQDVYNIGLTVTASMSYSWKNKNLDNPQFPAADCSVESQDYSHTFPLNGAPQGLGFTMSVAETGGICQPVGATDQYGRPIPINIPQKYSFNGVVIPCWFLNCTGTMRYDRDVQFVEEVVFNMTTNTQPILTSPTVEQNTEEIVLDGADVGEPLIVVEAWSDFANNAGNTGPIVPLAQIINPNNPTTPGGLSYQVCVVSGRAGIVEPEFSDIPGTLTFDGDAVWASMGPNPLANVPTWSPASPVPLGQIICYEPVAFDTNRGTFEKTGASVYYLCTTPGFTNQVYSQQEWFPPPATSDVTVVLPTYVPYIAGPAFNAAAGSQIVDGDAVWTSLGSAPTMLGIPIGGTPLNVTGRCYFPTDRGNLSLANLVYRGRARLRKKGRAIKIGWDCPFEDALLVTTRMNATIYDNRLPGGVATGKITTVKLFSKRGKLRGRIEIGVSVGYGGSVAPDYGTPEWVDADYVTGYQVYDGVNLTPAGAAVADVAYTPCIFAPFDDGFQFPLGGMVTTPPSAFPGTITTTVTSGQQAELTHGFVVQAQLSEAAAFIAASAAAASGDVMGAVIDLQQAYNSVKLQVLLNNLAANPVWTTWLLPPMQGSLFNGAYSPTVTPLELPMGINLQYGNDNEFMRLRAARKAA